MTARLSPAQLEHVAQADPACREEMKEHFASGASVMLEWQDVEPGVPPVALTVSGTGFWIDCCGSIDEARAKAVELGLRVEESKALARASEDGTLLEEQHREGHGQQQR